MKIRRFSEASFLLGIILLGLATAIMSKANLGMSMVAAPYYLIAAKVGVISVGTASYIFQGVKLLKYRPQSYIMEPLSLPQNYTATV